jgi:hypothetical protein
MKKRMAVFFIIIMTFSGEIFSQSHQTKDHLVLNIITGLNVLEQDKSYDIHSLKLELAKLNIEVIESGYTLDREDRTTFSFYNKNKKNIATIELSNGKTGYVDNVLIYDEIFILNPSTIKMNMTFNEIEKKLGKLSCSKSGGQDERFSSHILCEEKMFNSSIGLAFKMPYVDNCDEELACEKKLLAQNIAKLAKEKLIFISYHYSKENRVEEIEKSQRKDGYIVSPNINISNDYVVYEKIEVGDICRNSYNQFLEANSASIRKCFGKRTFEDEDKLGENFNLEIAWMTTPKSEKVLPPYIIGDTYVKKCISESFSSFSRQTDIEQFCFVKLQYKIEKKFENTEREFEDTETE